MRKWGSATFRTALDEENGRKKKKTKSLLSLQKFLKRWIGKEETVK
jgi:hypothetical protein